MIDTLLIKEDELYFKEFIGVLLDNGYRVTIEKIYVQSALKENPDSEYSRVLHYEVSIED